MQIYHFLRLIGGKRLETERYRNSYSRYQPPIFSASMNAACGMSTLPNWRMRFLPSFCFSRSLRLRVTSPQ
jgi:hypothetical protein